MTEEKIDIVLTWVDGKDPDWVEKREKYRKGEPGDGSVSRYRDWENLKYLFRGIEKYAPWANRIYFVTDHQCPAWINRENEKLVILNHEDFMPPECLPVFNSDAIEVNFHRIRGLSERFIILNDDFFFINPTSVSDFFGKNGQPVDIFAEYPVGCGGNNEVFSHILVNVFNTVGKYYSRKEYRRRLRKKIITPRYGGWFFYNLLMYLLPFPNFFGVLTPHFAQPFLKSQFEKVWELEGEKLMETSAHRFRETGDLNIYLFRIWNLMEGNFVPGNRFRLGKKAELRADAAQARELILYSGYRMICLNDECDEEHFEEIRTEVNRCLQEKLPDKCSFER